MKAGRTAWNSCRFPACFSISLTMAIKNPYEHREKIEVKVIYVSLKSGGEMDVLKLARASFMPSTYTMHGRQNQLSPMEGHRARAGK